MNTRVEFWFRIFGRLFSRCGLTISLLWLAELVLSRILPLRLFVICVRDLDSLVHAPLPDGGEYQLRVAVRSELMTASGDPANGLSADFVDTALFRGDICVGVFDANRLVSYCWHTSARVHAFADLDIEVGKDYIYGYKAATLPQYRGKGLNTITVLYAAKMLALPTGKGVVAYIDAGNDRSLISASRAGRFDWGLAMLWMRTGRRSRIWMTPLCRKLGVRFLPAGQG
jgi:hypothetical protein